MSRGRSSPGTIAKILQDITWDAGLASIARSAFRGLHKQRKSKKVKKPPKFVRFVYKGQFYRRPIAPKQRTKSKPPELLKLPPAGPQVIPQPFKTPPSTPAKKAEALVAAVPAAKEGGGSSGQQKGNATWSWKAWWKLNAPLVILNFGSLATLAGFTRTDVIELRSLAITGNVTFTVYSLLHSSWNKLPIAWNVLFYQFLFAGVNAYNIGKILNERKGKVHLTPHQEEIYNEHFQPHGVSPKQFEKVVSTGTVRLIKKGDILSRQGECISSVKLVVRGNTRANVMGRHLTAMGSQKGNRDSMQGGDSGAWIGEMAFLQSLWDKDHRVGPSSLEKKKSEKKPGNNTTVEDDTYGNTSAGSAESTAVIKSGIAPCNDENSYHAISTIIAVEDIELIEWSFEDMERVMKSSRELQDSITRAMTAAIVGKVVNFMVSRQSAIPKFSTLMDNWKSSQRRYKEDEESEDDDEPEMSKVSRTVQNHPFASSGNSK